MAGIQELRVVVVGVGIAGGVRVRDILNPHPQLKNVTLHGFVSRRELDLPGATKVTLDDALANSDVNAVLVCTENCTHEETIRKCLAAGKHVLVEFPLAISYKAVAPLYELAKEKGVVLYEEDIALLLPQHLAVKKLVNARRAELESVQTSLEGSLKCPGEEYAERNGHPLFAAISQLQMVMNILGDLTPVSASMAVSTDKITVEAKLKCPDDSPVTISILREKTDKPKRVSTFCYNFKDGTKIDNNSDLQLEKKDGEPGLFAKDLIQFTEVVRGTFDNSQGTWLTKRSLEITAMLVEMTQS